MNLLNIRRVGYGVRSIDELRAPGSRPERSPPSLPRSITRIAALLTTSAFTAPAAAATLSATADDRFAVRAAVEAEGNISEQNVERVIRQVLERLGK
nr:acetaldehyde dehydrogenase [Raoultella sp. NCTC 9187]